MGIEKNQTSFWKGKAVAMEKMNYRLRIEFKLNEFGIGISIFKPLHRKFPRKNFRLGIAIRILWVGLFLKMIENKADKAHYEDYDEKEQRKEFSVFHNKRLIAFKNNRNLNFSCNWYHSGLMLFYHMRRSENPDHFSISFLWAAVSLY